MAPSTDKSAVVALAVAADLNDQLTIAANGIQEAMDGYPQELVDARAAVQRAIWDVAQLMNFAHRNGLTLRKSMTPERAIEWARFGF